MFTMARGCVFPKIVLIRVRTGRVMPVAGVLGRAGFHPGLHLARRRRGVASSRFRLG